LKFGFSQTNYVELIPNIIQDVQRFGEAYIDPATDAAMYNVNSGWYSSAETKNFLEVELNVLSNISVIPNTGGNFILDPSTYNSIRFEDGYEPRNVASIFGSDMDISIYIDYETDEGTESIELELPPGIDNGNVNLLPTFFIQGNLGLPKGTELKFRYSPEIEVGDITTEAKGLALQHEFTSWLKEDQDFFLDIAGMIAYSNFEANYFIENEDPTSEASIVSDLDAWSFSLIASKDLNNFTFFGGLDYSTAKSISNFQGIYTLPEEGEMFQNVLDQIEIENKTNGFSGTLGINYLFGSFVTKLAVNLQKYSNLSIAVGYHFGK